MKKIKNNILLIIGGIIFAISSALLSFQLIRVDYYTPKIIIFTVIISFTSAIWFYQKTVKENGEVIKNNPLFTIISVILTIIVMEQLYLTKGIEGKELFQTWSLNLFKIKFFRIATVAALYIGIYLGSKIKKWLIDFYHALDAWDKKAYIIATIISSFLIIIAYRTNANWYLQYDKVYSLDSGWCFENILPNSTYYDIRHPILSAVTFPIWAIVNTLVKLILPSNWMTIAIAIIFQIINAQLLILIGLQLKILTKNKFVFIIYMLSFPTILYTMFFEKYQICVFLIVLYVFTICHKKEKSIPSLIAATGVMPTSCVIGMAELLTSDKVIEKLKKILKIVVITLITFICLGRGHIIEHGLTEMLEKKQGFSNKTYTISEKIMATTKMIENSLIALPSSTTVKENTYWWKGLETQISIVAMIIIGMIIIAIIKNRKTLFVKICSVWVIFSFVLFVILNWSTQETPLFTIYFSWAIIPLFIMGLDFILEKLKNRLNPKTVYGCMTVYIAIINVATMLEIQNFLAML